MARTVTLRQERWCRGRGPTPNHTDVAAMLDAIAAEIACKGGGPFAVHVEAWPPIQGRFFARLTIEFDQLAAREQSLRAWFQWQHPEWKSSWEPMPAHAAKILQPDGALQ